MNMNTCTPEISHIYSLWIFLLRECISFEKLVVEDVLVKDPHAPVDLARRRKSTVELRITQSSNKCFGFEVNSVKRDLDCPNANPYKVTNIVY